MLPVPDRAAALATAGAVLDRYVAVLRSGPDPGLAAIGRWSVGETACHTAHLLGILAGLRRGVPSPVTDHHRMAETWDRMLAQDDRRDPVGLADTVEAAGRAVLASLDPDAWDAAATWHAGLPVRGYTFAAIVANECALHGLDIARAAGRPWEVPRPVAELVVVGFLPLLGYFLDQDAAQGLDAVFRVDLRGGPSFFAEVARGEVGFSAQEPRRPDCILSVDPVAYLLVGFGRIPRLGALARGRIVAHGRKPWLGLRFARLFRSV